MHHLGIDRQLCIGNGDQEDPVLGLAINQLALFVLLVDPVLCDRVSNRI